MNRPNPYISSGLPQLSPKDYSVITHARNELLALLEEAGPWLAEHAHRLVAAYQHLGDAYQQAHIHCTDPSMRPVLLDAAQGQYSLAQELRTEADHIHTESGGK
jgi:hypothetical protein